MKNKKGWIRIVEAFMMILLITGVFLVILEPNSEDNSSQEIYEKEQEILIVIQLNDSLRESVLDPSLGSLPIELESFATNLKAEINFRTPSYLECNAKICKLNGNCVLSTSIDKSVYTQETIITSSPSKYDPRKLKLFCWEK